MGTDHTGAAPEQRLVFGGQLPFGNKPERNERPTKPEPELELEQSDPAEPEPVEAELVDTELIEAEPQSEATAFQREFEQQFRPAQPAVWDVSRPAHLVEAEVEPEAEPVEEEPQEPTPEYPDPPLTGDPGVDQVLAAVAQAVHGPLEEQLAVYDIAHRTLQDRLADVEAEFVLDSVASTRSSSAVDWLVPASTPPGWCSKAG